jgi:hypothetical protein
VDKTGQKDRRVYCTVNYQESSRESEVSERNDCAEVKGKAIPLQAWAGPEGSRRLRLPDFKTIGT